MQRSIIIYYALSFRVNNHSQRKLLANKKNYPIGYWLLTTEKGFF
jgi:hypothetical protein